MTKLLRDADQQNPKVAALMGNLKIPAERKFIVHIYRKNWKKMLMDKFPNINILLIDLRDPVQNCRKCFQPHRNRTLDRHIFLPRKHKPKETLQQYWNVLNGLFARCEFGNQTEVLVYDIFVMNMNNMQVQEKICTEPKVALQFAIAFEDGLKRQKSDGYINQEPKVKEQPICTVSSSNQRESWRCGAGNFALNHLSKCKAPNAMCN